MEQIRVEEVPTALRQGTGGEPALTPATPPAAALLPQEGAGGCGCGAAANNGAPAAPPSYVFAIGRIEMRFPTIAVEKEFMQATGRASTAGLSDRQATHAVLTARDNRYIARQLCWVLTIEGLETYLLLPRDPADFDLLLEAVREDPGPIDIDVVIGLRGPVAPAEMCNGLMLPVLAFDQIYSFDRDALIKAIPRPEGVAAKQEKQFRSAAGELFDRILQMADNAGATDEHRALNYLAVRYPAVYALATEAFGRNSALTRVEARPSSLSGVRKVMKVIFSFTNRETDVTEQYFVRVDVTEEFPFLVTKLSPYYER